MIELMAVWFYFGQCLLLNFHLKTHTFIVLDLVGETYRHATEGNLILNLHTFGMSGASNVVN